MLAVTSIAGVRQSGMSRRGDDPSRGIAISSTSAPTTIRTMPDTQRGASRRAQRLRRARGPEQHPGRHHEQDGHPGGGHGTRGYAHGAAAFTGPGPGT